MRSILDEVGSWRTRIRELSRVFPKSMHRSFVQSTKQRAKTFLHPPRCNVYILYGIPCVLVITRAHTDDGGVESHRVTNVVEFVQEREEFTYTQEKERERERERERTC